MGMGMAVVRIMITVLVTIIVTVVVMVMVIIVRSKGAMRLEPGEPHRRPASEDLGVGSLGVKYTGAHLASPGFSAYPPNALPGGKQLFQVESKWNKTFPPGGNCGRPGNTFSSVVRTFAA